MPKARPRYNICRWCGTKVENTTRGSQRFYHFHCRDEKRKRNQNIARRDPKRREERNRRERERKRQRRLDPQKRRDDNDRKAAHERGQREKARLFDQMNARMKIMQLKIEDLEQELSSLGAEMSREIRAIKQQLPGGKGVGL